MAEDNPARQRVLDRLISYVSPVRGALRQEARQIIAQLAYDATNKGAGRDRHSWTSGSNSADVEIEASLADVRDNCRELVRNNPFAGKAVELWKNHGVGTDLAPDLPSSQSRLRDTWDRWSEVCDPSGANDFVGQIHDAAGAIVEGGDVLVRRRRRRIEDGLPVPVQIEVLEGDYLDDGKSGKADNGDDIRMGVQYNRIGGIRGYWIFPKHPGDSGTFAGVGGDDSKFYPAEDFIHAFFRKRPGQTRGMPWFAPVVLHMHDLGNYLGSELEAKAAQARIVGVARSNSPLAGLTPGSSQTTNEDGKPVISWENMAILRLKNTEGLDLYTPKISDSFEDFVSFYLHMVSVGTGAPYEKVTGDLSRVSYISGRMGDIDFAAALRVFQHRILKHQLCRRVWAWFIEDGIDSGAFGKAALNVRPTWVFPILEDADQEKAETARKARIRNGTSSLPRELRRKGIDPEKHVAEIADFNAQIDAAEIVLDTDPRIISGAGQKHSEAGGTSSPGEESDGDEPAEEGPESEDEGTGDEGGEE